MVLIKDITVQQSLRVLEDIENKRSRSLERELSLQNVLLCLLLFDRICVFGTHEDIPVEESIEFYNRYFDVLDYLKKSDISESLERQALDYFFGYHKPDNQETAANENGSYNAVDVVTSMMGRNGYHDINRDAKQAIDYWLLAVEKSNDYCVSMYDSLGLVAFQWKQFAIEKLDYKEKMITEDEKELLSLSLKIGIPDFVEHLEDYTLPKEELIKKILYFRINPSFILIRKQINKIISLIESQKYKDAIGDIASLPERFESLFKSVNCKHQYIYELSFYPTIAEDNRTYRLLIMPSLPVEAEKLKKMFPIDERYFSRRVTMHL